jgi:predicted transcriptional regulator
MFKKIVLENSKRKKIYDFIKKNPGLHLRELQRRLEIPLSSLEHHVNYMVRHHIIYKEKEGGYTRYFAQQPTEEERKLISALRHEKMREIVSIVLDKKDAKFQDLKDYLNLPSSTLSYYLKYLVDYHILVRQQIGYESIYSIQDPKVRKALLMAEPSFTDRLIDKVLRSFMETNFKNLSQKTSER